MKTILILLTIVIFTVLLAANGDYKYSNIKRINKTSNPNRIIKSTYDVKYNLYCVLYVENGDTIGLDHIYPIELDSLINNLNKE